MASTGAQIRDFPCGTRRARIDQMGCSNGGGTPVNSFALVSYLPEPLAGFLDRLRADLVRECHAKAHVTILPPRPIFGPIESAWDQLRVGLHDFQPFRVELKSIEFWRSVTLNITVLEPLLHPWKLERSFDL